MAQAVQSLSTMQETWVRALGWEDPLEKEMTIHSSVLSESEVSQSCPTLRDPMDCSLPGSPAPGILQARTLEWDAISFSSA